MALGKQAKIINDKQVRAVLAELATRRYPLRDRVMFLLSMKAGMRAVEIASITWAMVTDAEGEIGEVIALQNRASKGRGGGRFIPMHPDLKAALGALHRERGVKADPDWHQCIIGTQISGISDIARTIAVVPMLLSAPARC